MPFYLRLPFTALAGVAMILWAVRGRLDEALLWTVVIGLTVIYPTTRFAFSLRPSIGTQRAVPRAVRHATPVYAMGGVCCLGGLMVLWALGAPLAALVLVMCAAPGALLGMALSCRGLRLPPYVTLAAFVGGVVFMYSWWGLGVLALGAWLSRARLRSGAHPRKEIIAAWAMGLGLAWMVYVPVLSLWSLISFFWGFSRWLSG